MRTFALSVLVGASVGIILGIIFIFVSSSFTNVYDPVISKGGEQVKQEVKNIFQKITSDPDHYFISSQNASSTEGVKVVYADLAQMKITATQNGEIIAEYPIKSIGREGTAWQTPIGSFDMNYKKENHFSSLGHVYMPWSMHFFGNYFIHGWPYYPDGTQVAEGYSGGCIRMATEDAKGVYDFVDRDTELVVFNSENIIEPMSEFQYEIVQKAPQLEANFLVADIQTGEVVGVHNQSALIQDSSFSKLMTAIISLESLNQYKDVAFNNVIMTVSDVLYSLVLADSDDAEELFFDFKNKVQFEVDMNRRAQSIGMNNTTYTHPLDAEVGQTTLEDTFRLVQYLAYYKPFLISVLKLPEYVKGDIEVISKHPLLETDEYVAGFVDADQKEIITLVDIDLKNEENSSKRFVIIVENSPDVKGDTKMLLEWLKTGVAQK